MKIVFKSILRAITMNDNTKKWWKKIITFRNGSGYTEDGTRMTSVKSIKEQSNKMRKGRQTEK